MKENLKTNDQVNRDAASVVPTPTTENGGSGSTHGSFSAIDFAEAIKQYEAPITEDEVNFYAQKELRQRELSLRVTDKVESVFLAEKGCKTMKEYMGKILSRDS